MLIQGDLSLHLGWPWPTIQANTATFANPAWAQETYIVAAEKTEVSVDLPQLLRGIAVLPVVRLVRPTVYLEQGSDGKKNWLMDTEQKKPKNASTH